MSRVAHLKISVENLGPIRAGAVELRPLTILIGPNNSGKTYFAQLLYALFKGLRDRLPLSPYVVVDRARDLQNRALFGFLSRTVQTSNELNLSELPAELMPYVRDNFRGIVNELAPAVGGALHEYFGVDNVGAIVRRGRRGVQLSVTVNEGALSLSLASDGSPSLRMSQNQPETVCLSRDDLDSLQQAGVEPLLTDWTRFLATRSWLKWLALNDLPSSGIYYLPSYRAGLLQSWNMILRFILRSLAPESLQKASVAIGAPSERPSGMLSDFLYQMLPSGPVNREDVSDATRPALGLLEGAILEGAAMAGDIGKGEDFVSYWQGDQTYSLSLASSMVAELAPLDILIRKKIKPGDLVIIDEPEAHLHPENQRLVARVVVRLVQGGVRVICPTHSSLFLHQVSNHLLASSASSELRSRLGFTESDILGQEAVGAYLFARSRGGTRIRPVLIEPGFGIAEDEFLRVVEELGAESFALSEEKSASRSSRP